MQVRHKELKNKKGEVTATVEVQEAESLAEAVELAGGEREAVTLFNRAWAQHLVSKHRPGRKRTGPGALVQGFRKLSPEVQAALRSKSAEEIAALLATLSN